MEGINLLPQLTEAEINKGVYRRKTIITSIASLGIIGAIIIALIAYQIFLKLSADDIKTRSKKAENQVSQYQEVEIANLALKEKLDKIEQILTSEIPVSTLVNQIGVAALTGTTIKISNISASANGETFVDGTAADSNVFSQWVDNLTSDSSQEFFAKINLISLNRTTEGNYKFSFKMTFLKRGVYPPK